MTTEDTLKLENDAMSERIEELQKELADTAKQLDDCLHHLKDWQHYASYLANHAAKGAPSFDEWRAKRG